MNKSTGNTASNTRAVSLKIICHACVAVFGICIGYLSSATISDWVYPLKSSLKSESGVYETDVAIALGARGLQLFRQHDRNDDDVLTLEEFIPIARLLIGGREHAEHLHNVGTDDDDPFLEVECVFKPLLLTSLTKMLAEEPKETLQTFSGLLNWTMPNEKKARFRHKDFKNFLPSKNSVAVGKPWYLVKSSLNVFAGQLSSNVHEPPPVHPDEFIIHNLYTMFHLRPFIYPRFAPQGTVALIRALNNEVLDIAFRSHVEFQLNELPMLPFWFTPSQFKGRLIISRNGSVVHHFRMCLPTNRKLNVDLEWLTGPSTNDAMDNMEVDIGFVPQMELSAPLPDTPDFVWDADLPLEEAYKILDVTMYPFKEVMYYPFEEAFHHAVAQKKLVHSIILWGALDDQSC